MSKQLVKAWLADPNRKFEDGLKLYNQHKRDSSRDAFFNSQPTFKVGTIQFNMLLGELTRIARILDQLPEDKQPQEQSKPITLGRPMSAMERKASSLKVENFNPTVDYNALPDEMKAKFDSIREVSKIIGGLKVAMDSATADDERKSFAEQLLVNWEKRKVLWAELDEWNAKNGNTGKKAKPNFGDMSVAELKKARKIRMDNITRAKKDSKNKKKAEVSISEWSKEIDEIDTLIGLKTN